MDDSEARKWANEMAEGFGWKWPTEVTRRPNWWQKLTGAFKTFPGKVITHLGSTFSPVDVGDAVKEGVKKEVRTIKEDATDILMSHSDYSPQELAEALKKKKYPIEEIRRLSPVMKEVK